MTRIQYREAAYERWLAIYVQQGKKRAAAESMAATKADELTEWEYGALR